MKIKHRFFGAYLAAGHIPREILSISLHYYIKEDGVITGHVVSRNYKIPPSPAGGLEIPLLLTFSVEQQKNS